MRTVVGYQPLLCVSLPNNVNHGLNWHVYRRLEHHVKMLFDVTRQLTLFSITYTVVLLKITAALYAYSNSM
jgi:hypothetical protein